MDAQPRHFFTVGTCTFIWRTIFTSGLGALGFISWWGAGALWSLSLTLHDLPRDIASINQTLAANHDEFAEVKRETAATRARLAAVESIIRASRAPSGGYIPLPPGVELTEPWNRDHK